MSTDVSRRGRRQAAAPTEVSELGEVANNLGLLLIGAGLVQLAAFAASLGGKASLGVPIVDPLLSTVGSVGGLALAVGLPVGAAVVSFWRAPERTENAIKAVGRALVVVYAVVIVAQVGAMAFGVEAPLPAILTPPVSGGAMLAVSYLLPLGAAIGIYYYTRLSA